MEKIPPSYFFDTYICPIKIKSVYLPPHKKNDAQM